MALDEAAKALEPDVALIYSDESRDDATGVVHTTVSSRSAEAA